MASRQLAEFLSEAAARRFAWGRHDCMLFAADWAVRLTGDDPAAAWRGSYDDHDGAFAILHAEGGPATIMAQALEPLGWRPIEDKSMTAGDIVLARPPHHPRAAGIAAGDGCVAFLTGRGVLVWPAEVLAVWRHA